MDQLTNTFGWAPGPFFRWLLFIYTGIIGIELGAGLFVSRVVFPLWASSQEAVMGWLPDSRYYLEEGDFFMFASPATMLLSIVTLIASWKAAPRLRTWIRFSTITFMIVFIWSVLYFIPVQDVVKGEAGTKVPYDELGVMLRNFVSLNYIRQLMLVFAFGSALHALGISYQLSNRQVISSN